MVLYLDIPAYNILCDSYKISFHQNSNFVNCKVELNSDYPGLNSPRVELTVIHSETQDR